MTYHSPSSLSVGQLVTVPLRGRILPGFVAKINTGANFRAQIKPIKNNSNFVLPENFVNYFMAVAQYYLISPSTLLKMTWPFFNQKYVKYEQKNNLDKDSKRGSTLYFTPSIEQANRQVSKFITIGADAASRQQIFWQSFFNSVNIAGSQNIAWLPYKKINRIIFDSPLLSPFESARSPGIHSLYLASKLAFHYGCPLIVRTVIPKELLCKRYHIKNITVRQPPLNKVETVLTAEGWLNKEMQNIISNLLSKNKKVGIYYNSLSKIDQSGKIQGLANLANQLSKMFSIPIGVVSDKENRNPNAQLTVFTNKILYQQISFDQVIVLDPKLLLSPNRPHSHIEALEILGLLASRYNLTVQSNDSKNVLFKACQANFNPQIINALNWPHFNKRIIRLVAKKPNIENELAELKKINPSLHQNLEGESTVITLMTKQKVDSALEQFILKNRANFRIFSDVSSLQLE